jgi:hypothetical protein
MRRTAILALLCLASCGGASGPPNGRQACAATSAGRRCPDGFECRSDNHCWQPGTGPGQADGGDGAAGDGAPIGEAGRLYDAAVTRDAPPFEAVPSHSNPSGYRQVPGGTVSVSENYRLVRTLPLPPGSQVMQSENYRLVGGLVGATQK